ncbi:hypothetical protein D3C78_1528890 [compost metagenome]
MVSMQCQVLCDICIAGKTSSHKTVQYLALHCTALHCTALRCTALDLHTRKFMRRSLRLQEAEWRYL